MAWEKMISREGVDLTTISFVDEIIYQQAVRLFKKQKEFLFTLCHERQITHYVDMDTVEFGRRLYQDFFSTPDQIKQYYTEGLRFLDQAKIESEQSKNHNDLLQAFDTFIAQYSIVNHIYSITSFFALESWQADFEIILNQLIEQRGLQTQKANIVEAVYTPWKDTAIRLAEKEARQGADPKDLADKYQFLRSWSIVWYRPLDAAWAKNLVTQGTAAHMENPLAKDQAIKLLQPDSIQSTWLELAPYMIFFKDWRDDLRRAHVFSWSWLFERIGKQFGATSDDCGYLTKNEVREALVAEAWPKETIQRRKKGPCILTADIPGTRVVVKDQNIGLYENIMDEVLTHTQQASVKGLVAQGGEVVGRVVIVKTYHDIKHVEVGNILVANTTHPTYLPGMQKAAAFVTNEGGIISHAAIVAREMKKPCIVGTKNATTVLRNGDLVKVDGNTGTVSVLKTSL